MKRMLMVAGCIAIAAMTAFAGTNQVASAAQGKEDARAEAKREREAQRKALEMIQGELKRQREGHATKVGRDEAHVDELLDIYADRTGKTILRDPTVPNTVIKFNLRDEHKFTKEEYIGVLESVLEMNGVHLEPSGEKLVNVFPSRVAASKGIPIIMTPKRLEEKGRIVSMTIPFKNIRVTEAYHALEVYKSVAGLFAIYERTNSIVITDVDKNINRMLEIAKTIDVAPLEPDRTFARQIKFAKAQDIMRALSILVLESTKGAEMALNQGSLEKNAMIKRNEAMYLSGMPGGNEGAIRGKVLLLADDRTNKLIVITRKANMDIFDSVIAELDVEVIPANGNSP